MQRLEFAFFLETLYIVVEALSKGVFGVRAAKSAFYELPFDPLHAKAVAAKQRAVALKYDGTIATNHTKLLEPWCGIDPLHRVAPHITLYTYCYFPFHNTKLLSIPKTTKGLGEELPGGIKICSL